MNRRAFLRRMALLAAGHFFAMQPLARALEAPGTSGAKTAQVVLIIDDIGYSLQRLNLFLELDIALTFAVLPRLPVSAKAAAAVVRAGHQVLLHQPMQPIHRRMDPGPGALFAGDSPQRIRHVLGANLHDLSLAIGVNNHMGSLFTSSGPDIQMALEVIRDSGLFFIDSLTSSRSKAYQTARRLHIPTSRRNVFLDNRPEVPYVLNQLQQLTVSARRTGLAVGVGHPHPQTAEAIGRFKSVWQQHGVVAVHSSQIFDRAVPA